MKTNKQWATCMPKKAPKTLLIRKRSSVKCRSFLLLLLFFYLSGNVYGQVNTALKNQYLPLTSNHFTNLRVNNSTTTELVLLPPSTKEVDNFSNKNNTIDANTANAASRNFSADALNNVWLEVENLRNEVFPAGTYAGFVVNKAVLQLGLQNSVSISTYLNGTATGDNRSGSSIVSFNLGNKSKIGLVTTKNFDKIRITFSGVTLADLNIITSLLGGGAGIATEIYYAEVILPKAGPTPVCNINTALVHNTYPATVNFGTKGTSSIAEMDGILNGLSNIENIVNANTADAATLNTSLNVVGGAHLSVKLLAGGFSKGHYAGFELENGSLIKKNVLNEISVSVYNKGVLVQKKAGLDLIETSTLTTSKKQTIGFLVTEGTQFDEIRIDFNESLMKANLGSILIYHASVKSFCPPNRTLGNYTRLVNGQDHNMGVAVSGNNSGLANANILDYSQSMDNLVDNDQTNYVSLNNSLIDGSAQNTASLAVATPAHTFSDGEFVGFVIRGSEGLIDLGAATGMEISTYKDGVKVENVASNSMLNLSALGANILGRSRSANNMSIVGFKTSKDFDEVKLTVDNLAGVGNELKVFEAFVASSEALPVSNYDSLNAIIINDTLRVGWVTVSEKNNKEFIVERSFDGTHWEKIGTLASLAPNGNSQVRLSYKFEKLLGEVNMMAVFPTASAFLLLIIALALCSTVRRRKGSVALLGLVMLLTGVTIASCKKEERTIVNKETPLYIRVGQVDANNTVSYTKAMKVTVN